MNKTIDMMVKLLEKNTIPLPYGAKKMDGGSNYEREERFHALVAGYSGVSSFIIDFRCLKAHGFQTRLLLGPTSIQWSILPHG